MQVFESDLEKYLDVWTSGNKVYTLPCYHCMVADKLFFQIKKSTAIAVHIDSVEFMILNKGIKRLVNKGVTRSSDLP